MAMPESKGSTENYREGSTAAKNSRGAAAGISGLKPPKPSPDFPLYAHNRGKWAKKIKGKLCYFGYWDDPAGALGEYQATLADVKSREIDTLSIFLTVKDACNHFLTAKDAAVTAGKLSSRSFMEYKRTCIRVGTHFGYAARVTNLTPTDFAGYQEAREKHLNIVAVGNEITRVKTLFKWLWDTRLISEPLHFGPDFKRASLKALRRHKRLQGKKLFSRGEIRLLFDECGTHMQAMILLGINCGFGNSDCATLPIEAVNLEAGVVIYPRPKTEVDRTIPLWPETVKALKRSARRRYKARPEAEGRFFVMPKGVAWDNPGNPVAKHFRQARERAGVAKGGFYWLRHTLETIGGGAKDQVAVNAIMGHVDSSMAATYREGIEPERLKAVTDHVRKWLFGR
jgi:integrase